MMWRFNWKFLLILIVIGGVLGAIISIALLSSGRREYLQVAVYCGVAFSIGMLIYCAFIIVSSTGKIKNATHEEYKDALLFKRSPDQAVLYLMRSQFIGFAKALPLYIQDKELWLKGKKFYCLTFPAGTYTISGDKRCQNKLTLAFKAGGMYFVDQEMMASMFKTGYQHVVIEDIEKAKQSVANCKMLTAPGNN